MLEGLFKHLEKPKLYAESTSNFWDDEHISMGLLEAHLNPRLEAASRHHDFMDKSVDWIAEITPSSAYKSVLDLGCGPGLYAERLYRKGYKIASIDFSKRSINYSKEKARQRNQDINYIYKNYLEMDCKNDFDLVLLIYCDFVVLPDDEREVLLNKVFDALKPGGKFIFDVFTEKEFEDTKENHSFFISEEGGFWKPDKHIGFESHFIYESGVRVNQHVIIDNEGEVSIVRNWFKAYTTEAIVSEVKMAGFHKVKIYSDVTGKPYTDESKTICIIAEK